MVDSLAVNIAISLITSGVIITLLTQLYFKSGRFEESLKYLWNEISELKRKLNELYEHIKNSSNSR